VEIEGHTELPSVTRAMEELAFFASEVKILGSYKKSALRENFLIA
jgi:prephenate dehydratase